MNSKSKDKKLSPLIRIELILVALGIIFIGSNLRAPITSVGPVINEITASIGISKVTAGMITTLPLLTFALLSGFTPKISKYLGMELSLFFSLLVLMLGLFIRSFGNISTLFIGAGLVGCAITIGNVLLPAYIKNKFPRHAGLMTGIYSVSMNLTAALAAGFSIQLGKITGFGWRGSIGIWIILAFISLLVWLPQVKKNERKKEKRLQTQSAQPLWKSKLAWAVALFMGLQSFIFYCIAAWLPAILKDWGIQPEDSGWILSYIQLAMLPITFVAPIIAGRMKNQLLLVCITCILMLLGISGIVFGKTEWIVYSAILIGIAGGLAFSLAMMFFVLRTGNPSQAAELSGMSQSIGYLLAASGPPLFGAIYDYSHNWTISLCLLILATFSLLIAGLVAGRNKQV